MCIKQHGSLELKMDLLPSLRIRQGVLALGLCLLAALFALEAKTAWYWAANGPGVDISSQKAFPADLPTVVCRQSPSQLPNILPLAMLLLTSMGAIAWKGKGFLRGIDVDFNHVPVSSAPYFSPSLFFRPPPAL
jgi:hypothetical protein